MSRSEAGGWASAKGKGSAPPKSKIATKCGPAKGAPGARAATAGRPQSKLPSTGTTRGKTKQPGLEALPPFSLPLPPPSSPSQLEKEKQKVIRRNKPKGEDVNKMKEIVKNVRGQALNGHEFIGLIAPSTGDNGKLLQSVLADELSLFRATARKIYETTTEDISDVLINEQLQLKEFTEERNALLDDKMQRNLNEIWSLCPGFDFEAFYTKDEYLDELFPLIDTKEDPDELEALLRQQAYHRYLWLKSEGDRLKDENSRLQKRLRELKTKQKAELEAVTKKEKEAEEARVLLEAAQDILEDRLEELNESLGKSLVELERCQSVPISLQPLPSKAKTTEKFQALKSALPKPSWASKQAAEIEATNASEALNAERSKISVRSKILMGKSALKRPSKTPARKPPPKQETSPFHYSPAKTPPGKGPPPRDTSPFHYSPNRSPARMSSPTRDDYGQAGADSEMARMKMSISQVVTEKQPEMPRGRARAPRDTWGGFY